MANRKQIELSDQTLSLEARAEWRDLRQDAYRDYAEHLESALALVKKRDDAAGKYARDAFTRELRSVKAALAGVPSIEIERGALKSALQSLSEAVAAIDTARDVDALLRARATAELKGRAVAAAFAQFTAAAARARLPGLERFPLHAGRLASWQAIADLQRHAQTLDDRYDARAGNTFAESAAVETARGYAELELGSVPWVVAQTEPASLTFRLWLFHVERRHKIGPALGAETYAQLFHAAAE